MERDGRSRFNVNLECIETRIKKIDKTNNTYYKLVFMSNGERYLVDTRLINEDELRKILGRSCYFQVGRIKRIGYVFDFVKMD